ncbi:HAMP domain-containing sensor histidine kinase [Nonomuraea sp. NPDC049152]|uniref:HAMP domain-containing sensor histidine kinase n=1 Tax=Nonomuraea sp. NPDC049152 TaxID=3154350 RepID=UPI003407F9D2
MRRRSLRSRLTLLVTLAVAAAIAVSAIGCYLIVQHELYVQLDRTFDEQSRKRPEAKLHDVDWLLEECQSFPQDTGHYGRPQAATQVVYADGRPNCYYGAALTITPEVRQVAAHGGSALFNGTTVAGKPVRVFVESPVRGMAIMDTRPLGELLGTLRTLTVLLTTVAAIGVLGAASAGLLISRTALRPVGRLTKAVEHIAKTEDLNTTIPVDGTDEIARLSRSFNAMTAALAGSRERQQQLVADAGHELRTPLTSLRTNIDLLLRSEHTGRPIEPKAKERLLVNLKAQFEELSTLVGDLLQLSRGESDHEPHVKLAFHDVVDAAVARARLRGADVTTDLDPWYVEGHPSSLERAVMNLLDNAAKFSPGGKVEVELRRGDLTVRDHGPGIPAEELPHVFERFWRSPSARSLPGSGLGLAIVAQAVQEAAGEVRLDNAPGGGAVARISLPGSPVLTQS